MPHPVVVPWLIIAVVVIGVPMVASVGTSYTGIDRLLIATDLRFLDYRDTNGFRHTGFDQRGALHLPLDTLRRFDNVLVGYFARFF